MKHVLLLLAILGCNQKPSAPVQQQQMIPVARGVQVRITSPAPGENVGIMGIVRGTTTAPERNHYIIVTPVSAPARWVQDGPATQNGDGTWSANAIFGTADKGINEDFQIVCVATEETLEAGTIEVAKLPRDGVYSAPVIVHRP